MVFENMVANPKFNAVIDISFLDDEDKREVQTEHRVKNREDGQINSMGEIMEINTLLEYSERSQLRAWLKENHFKEKECWVVMSRSKTPLPGILPYIDVVEEALCFGWIDSTLKKLPDGRLVQRLSPRRKNSHWTQLNMDRCMDLEDRGLMTEAGRRAFENAYGYK